MFRGKVESKCLVGVQNHETERQTANRNIYNTSESLRTNVHKIQRALKNQ